MRLIPNGGIMFKRPERFANSSAAGVPGGRGLRADGRVTVVAEAAQGFEGDLTLARLLVRGAAAAGADVVKLQLVYAAELTTPAHRHHALFRDLELSDADWQAIAAEARAERIGMAFDVFGPRSLALALACGADAVKIHASDVFNDELVDAALRGAPHLYLSTGGVRPDELAPLIERCAPFAAKVTLLYGFQAEPTPAGANRMARLGVLRRQFPNVGLGFMDHTDGAIDDAGWLAALALPYGVRLIEKHITLDRALEIEDFLSAVAPREFQAYVSRLRTAEDAIGSDDLALSAAEEEYRGKALKVAVAARDLPIGAVVRADDIALLRTPLEAGRSAIVRRSDAVGRRLGRAVSAGSAIYGDDLA